MLGNWRTLSKKQHSTKPPFGLVKGQIFPDSFCKCFASYNWIPWPEITRDSLCLISPVTANRGKAKAEIQNSTVCSCNCVSENSLPALNSWVPPHKSAVFSSGKATNPKLHRAWNKSRGSGFLENLETFRPPKMRRGDWTTLVGQRVTLCGLRIFRSWPWSKSPLVRGDQVSV